MRKNTAIKNVFAESEEVRLKDWEDKYESRTGEPGEIKLRKERVF